MEKDILSLRNIYRFLTVNDYPVYSMGVFKEDNRKGLTLTKFWQENLLYEFRNGYYGKMIWNLSGGRNRHTSEICNRSQVLKYYAQYTEELISAINEKILVQQINQFKTCLQERKGDWAVLEKKIEAAITVFHAQDDCFEKDVLEFFQKNLEDGEALFDRDMEAKSFFLCWMLTFLTIHAMAGEEMNNVQMKNLRQNRAFSLKSLWAGLQDGTNNGSAEVHFLTGQNNALCITPLPMIHFFGRERELFDLREILEQGGYYLLSGMGGIGKTELLRQLLHLCVEHKLVDEVAVIQYEGSLKTGCMKAFPNMHLVDGENTLNEAMARIRMQEGKRVLTLVDNMNNTLEEDPELEQLLTLPGTVILTSRLTELEGFTTYEVKAPGRETGMLIFRDNYGKALSKEDKEELQELLEQDIWCHTLTLRLLGSTAKVKGWSVGVLKEKLEEDGFRLLKTRENREISLAEMYRRMYDLSELNESQIRLLRCFAALPYQNYTLEFCETYLAECCTGSVTTYLDNLKVSGWLTGEIDNYMLHPVIAECITQGKLSEKDIKPFLNSLMRYWESCGATREDDLEAWFIYSLRARPEDYEFVEMLEYITRHIQGTWSKELNMLIVMAGIMAYSFGGFREFDFTYVNFEDSKVIRYWMDILMIPQNYVKKETYYLKHDLLKETEGWMSQSYRCILAEYLLDLSEHEKAYELLDIDISNKELQVIQAFCFGNLYTYKTQLLEARTYCKKAIELARECDFPKGLTLQTIIQFMIELQLVCGEIEDATKWLKELTIMVENYKTVAGQYMISLCNATRCRCMGNYNEAYEYQKEVISRGQNLYGLTIENAIAYGDCALILGKMGRYEESEAYFFDGIERMQKVLIPHVQLHRIYNNMGEMYINWCKPSKAILALEKANEYGKDIKGIGAAEVYRNFARAYRLLGDTEREYENLKQAVPLLAEAYGPDHERTVAMRERLEEVEKIIK